MDGYDVVKPSLSQDQVVQLCRSLYGIEPHSVQQLNGYDDQNFWIKSATNLENNKHLKEIWPNGYVLKITNWKESKNRDLIEAQIQILLHLEKHRVTAPVPLQNVLGNYCSFENISGKDGISNCHAIRMLTFRKGQLLNEVQVDQVLAKELGIFLCHIDTCLKSFSHSAFENRDLLFMLDKLPLLKNFLHVIKDKARLEIVSKCIEEFENRVIPALNNLEKGIIHGDFNEQNVLVEENKVAAILDLGDVHYAPYVFELAIGLAYLIILTMDFNLARLFLDGYTERRQLFQQEKSILTICVKARLCQSLVLGLQAHSLNPQNDYLLSTQESGWKALILLFEKGDQLLFPSDN